jgi:hypothetical protein
MAKARFGSAIKVSKDLNDEFSGCDVIWLLSCLPW